MGTVPYPAPVEALPGGTGSPYDHIVDLIKIIKQTARAIPRAVASLYVITHFWLSLGFEYRVYLAEHLYGVLIARSSFM